LAQPEPNQAGQPLQGNEIGFSFVITRQVCSTLAKDQITSITVSAVVQVNYANDTKKRYGLQSTGSDTNSFSISSSIQDDGNGPTDTTDVVTAFTSGVTNTGYTALPSDSNYKTTIIPTNSKSSVKTETSNAFGLFVSSIALFLSLII